MKNYTHNQSGRLTPADPVYKQWIFRYTFLELEKDLGEKGDITTELLFKGKKEVIANITAGQDGILAGMQEISYFLKDMMVNILKKDGAEIKKGDKLMELSGDIHDVLKVERVILNLVGRMSGVSTITREFVSLAPNVLITPTRKTLWGWLDKRACVLGGGGTHRLSLEDAVLIKDNHKLAFGTSIEDMLKKAFNAPSSTRFIEIEVENVEEAIQAASAYELVPESLRKALPFCIMFDNMSPADIQSAVARVKNKNILLEASGGITKENVKQYAETGVDIISAGAITHSAPFFDVSLHV